MKMMFGKILEVLKRGDWFKKNLVNKLGRTQDSLAGVVRGFEE